MQCAGRCDLVESLATALFAEWLLRTRSHAELAHQVDQLFRHSNVKMGRVMREDFNQFLEDGSTLLLAECLALNHRTTEDWRKWVNDETGESQDPYRVQGVTPRDFCAERGPGRE